MSRRKKGKRNQSIELNDRYYRMYYEQLMQMACSVWRWENLPPEIDQRYLELALFDKGLVTFFYDDDYDKYFALTASPDGNINMYNNPVRYIAYGASGYRKHLTIQECVPIWNNYLRRPDFNAMQIFARRLADIDRTVDTNLLSQKMPIFVKVPESQRLTIQNMMEQYTGNQPIMIAADNMFNPQDLDYLTSNAPYITDKLHDAKSTIWGEAMTYLGIDNTNIAKAERVQSAEVRANNGQIEANRLIRANCRREACKAINRMFGLHVWCDFNHDISTENFSSLFGASSISFKEGGV